MTVDGVPLALFRTADGAPAALLDRCPHRHVPLSLGRVTDRGLRCAYHGWQFDGRGTCVDVPGRAEPLPPAAGLGCTGYPALDRDGLVWVHTAPTSGRTSGPTSGGPTSSLAATPAGPPSLDLLPSVDRPVATLRHRAQMAAPLELVAENILDVPHTAFLHGGLFRGRRPPTPVEVQVDVDPTSATATYRGEPSPPGWVGRLLAGGAGQVTVEHVDRFRLPAICEVRYGLRGRGRIDAITALSPVDAATTRLFTVVQLDAGRLSWPLLIAAAPLILWLLRQDAQILAHQTGSIARFGSRFGSTRFASTELDVLGSDIRRLRRGEVTEPRSRTTTMLL